MIPTPDLSHLKAKDYEHVYEPAEDTFILLDALEEDANELRCSKPRLCFEIGSGSGCVSTFVGKILGSSSCLYICSDINEYASRSTLLTGKQNQVSLDPVVCSLTSAFDHRLKQLGGVDLLVFNPPYVPTYTEEASNAQGDRDIQGSWAGGSLGMEITNRVLDSLGTILTTTGRFYLVAVKDNDVPAIRRRMEDLHNLKSKIVLQRRAGREYLYVIKFFFLDPRIDM
ncbi:S-adenosyl-L-methionine-dependent methyltransferase [Pyrrhoderma noxium]|uniref:S-adenosyl-L-methionine-dependent methyltransferase n=1 Tax=Pyrrhoderma noxium TaxID=2282107 RepID=A0A286UQH1_9AGAM|nr:S-adenosyl-L-methionine-dependent methyltransferase [Pyrrhoderma noxium]